MILNALAGKPLPIYGTGGNVRDWLFVEDHCRAIWHVVQHGKPGEMYNVGGNSEKTNLEVVDTLCALLDELVPDSPHRPHADLKTFVADRPGHDWRYAIDATKLREKLGWGPTETFETGMRRTVQWYLDHLDWCEAVKAGELLGDADDIAGLVVGLHDGRPVYLRDVADIRRGVDQPDQYVWYGLGAGAAMPVVARFQPGFHLLFADGVGALLAAITVISLAFAQKLLHHRGVTIEAVGLVKKRNTKIKANLKVARLQPACSPRPSRINVAQSVSVIPAACRRL